MLWQQLSLWVVIFSMAKVKKITKEALETLKLAAKQFNGTIPYEEDLEDVELIPEVGIKGSGIVFCYNPDSKSFVRIRRGQKAIILDEYEDDEVLIYTHDGFVVIIKTKELLFTGFD